MQRVIDLAWLEVFNDASVAASWSLAEWDVIVRITRAARLLARLHAAIVRHGNLGAVPHVVRRHLEGAALAAQARRLAVERVIARIPADLQAPSYPLVLLKGAAYMGQDLPIGAGRMPSDLDILVPRSALAEVRFRLQVAGWREPEMDEHDRRYYLEWSHELPPMTHPRHAVELDVHHSILPPRGGTMPDASLLLKRLRPTKWPAWQALDDVDQVLHSAGHLFFDAEPAGRLRDIVDLDGLFRMHDDAAAFWAELPRRAATLRLTEPLVLAVHFTRSWMRTPMPPSFVVEIAQLADGIPRHRLWRAAFDEALRPTHPDGEEGSARALARWLLLARYHAHRLPPRVLVPHLWRKWRMQREPQLPE